MSPKQIEWSNFEEARKFVRSLKLTSHRKWRDYCRGKIDGIPDKPENIPGSPERIYSEEWKGYSDWLGKKERVNPYKNVVPYKEASLIAKELGIKSASEWRRRIVQKKSMIARFDFDGMKEQLHGISVQLESDSLFKGLEKNKDYIKLVPQNPALAYRGKGWTSWSDFLQSNNLEFLGFNLKEFREQHLGESLTQMADNIGVNYRTLQRIEDGEVKPSADVRFKIHNYFNTWRLINGEERLMKEGPKDKNESVFADNETSSRNILNAVENSIFYYDYEPVKNKRQLKLFKKVFKLIAEYRDCIYKASLNNLAPHLIESAKIEYDFSLAELLIELNKGNVIGSVNTKSQYGLFMYDKGTVKLNSMRTDCTLFYIGNLNSRKVRNRGSNKHNIELNIAQFGLDKPELEWSPVRINQPYYNNKGE